MIVFVFEKESQQKLSTMIFFRIQNFYISAQKFAEFDVLQFRAFSQCKIVEYYEIENSICAISSRIDYFCFIVKRLHLTFLTNNDFTQNAKKKHYFCASID